MTTPSATRKPLGQILLRIDDEHGHHIIRKNDGPWRFTIEGYATRPESYQAPPAYFMPIAESDVAAEFAKQGKEWRS